MPKRTIKNIADGQEENYNEPFILDHFKSKNSWNMPSPHKHNCHELYFLLEGSTQYCLGDDIYTISPGDIVIIPQGKFHRTLVKTSKKYDRKLVYFTDEFTAPFYNYMGKDAYDDFLNLGSVHLSQHHYEQAQALFNKLDKENLRRDIYSDMTLSHIFCELTVLILRHGKTIKKSSGTTENRVLEAVHHINNHYNQEITLQQVAKIACMEATYFSKCFRKLTGMSFQEYVINTRLKMAEEFLTTSPLSISEIAENCGFLSSNYFGDMFKKYKGMSPRAYRKQHQQ